ncbi:MAG: hypothetical protein KGI54_15370 [Pseudomonadota bacterium]|nr:hypothetical protein [Pseudomonadota bacterium]
MNKAEKEARKTYMEMRRMEQLARGENMEFIPCPKGSKPMITQSRKHWRTTMKIIREEQANA